MASSCGKMPFTLDMNCASGETVFARTWTELGTDGDRNVRTEAGRPSLRRRIRRGPDRSGPSCGRRADGFYTDTREGPAVAYPDLRGDKTPFVNRDDMTIGLEHYLTVAAALFVIGIFGIFLNRKNVIIILMSIELMLLAVNINLVAFSSFLGDLTGQVFTLFILTVAAAEAAIGLAILVCFFRNRGTIAVEDVNVMKG
jgi:NADH-quinone oxidoreductase subunit K